ncbi:MAG TPA: MarR family transcriptional regulator [Bacillota bacterium]|nr:MarR family transcriptional regulator [Bacillota bacterium]
MIRNPSPPTGSNPTEAAFHSLLRTFGLLRQVMEPYFAQFGISSSQWAILRVLQRAAANGEVGLRLTDLGERLLIQPPSVTGVVDRLERQGLVQRSESKTDLRVRRVSLTPEGQQLVAKVLSGHAQQIQALFGALQSAEVDHLAGLLRQMETHLAVLAHRPSEGTRSGRKPLAVGK